MPPKARSTATRGRVRGRGKATTAAAPGGAETQDEEPGNQSADATVENASTSTSAAAPQAVTPRNLSDPPSPNSSPVTVPTETPAPTPARVVAPSRSTDTGPPTSTRGGAVSLRGLRGQEKPAPAASRFKPKARRRDDTEREELAKKELARVERVNATYAREQARLLRGRGGFGRGRGDIMGRGVGMGRGKPGTASGIFGVTPEGLKHASGVASIRRDGGGGGSSRSGGGGGGGGSGGGYSTYSGGSGGGHKSWVDDPEYPDEDTDAPRVNIEDLNKDEEEEVTYLGTRQIPIRNRRVARSAAGGLDPVRLERIEHKERVTVVNTADVKSEDPDLVTVDESRSSKKAKVKEFQGVYQGEDNVKVKSEVIEDDTGPSLPEPSGLSSPPPRASSIKSSPDSKRKTVDPTKIGDDPMDIVDNDDAPAADDMPSIKEDDKPSNEKGKKVPRPSSKRDKVPVFQTDEDREEWDRIQEDLLVLREELYGPPPASQANDADGDQNMDPTTSAVDRKQGRLYLFQFPPVMPILYDPLVEDKPMMRWQREKEEADRIKGKGKEAAPNAGKPKPKPKPNPDLLMAEEAKIKLEEEVDSADKDREERPGRDPLATREGYVGKLRVYKSGKTELDWGGMNFNVGRGAGSNFLTTGMIVDFNEQGVLPPAGGSGPVEGKAYSMGQIMGKFVVTPDWDTLLK